MTSPDTLLVSPTEALDLQKQGALIIDVRDGDDYKTEHIAGAVSIPQIFYHLSTTTDEEPKQFFKYDFGLCQLFVRRR